MADAPLWTSLWCMLCSGGIGDEHWTKEFTLGMDDSCSELSAELTAYTSLHER